MATTATLSYQILGGGRIAVSGLNGSGVFETPVETADPNVIIRAISQQFKAAPTTTAGAVTISVT